MTNEVDISTVLIEGEYATIMGVKYKRVDEPKTPAEEAFKRVYTYYPVTDITDPCWDGSTWTHFVNGYKSAQEDYKVGEFQPTPIEPEELKTLYQTMYDEEWCKSGCYLVKEWMSQYTHNVMSEEYKNEWIKGYDYCLLVLEENLKND